MQNIQKSSKKLQIPSKNLNFTKPLKIFQLILEVSSIQRNFKLKSSLNVNFHLASFDVIK